MNVKTASVAMVVAGAVLTGCATTDDGASTILTPATTPATTAAATGSAPSAAGPGVSGIQADPGIAARIQRDTGGDVRIDSVLVIGRAGDETIAVVDREATEAERTHHGRAASMWIAKGDGRFRKAADYLSYNFTCRNDDPVCPEIRPGGLGFVALRQQPGGKIFVVVGGTRDRSVEITTAEGKAHQIGVVPSGAVVEVTTAEPYRTRVAATMPDGRRYQLMIPPFGVVTG